MIFSTLRFPNKNWIALVVGAVMALSFKGSTLETPSPLETAIKLDPAGRRAWREPIPGAFRSRFGTQFHPFCLEQLERDGHSIEQTQDRLEQALSAAVKDILDCKKAYPELTAYLHEWIMQMRRSVIVCSSRTSSELNAGGLNFSTSSGLPWVTGSPSEYTGIDIKQTSAVLWHRKPIILIPKDAAAKLVTAPTWGGSRDFFVHEGFHSTHANNLNDHNEIERISPSDDNRCKQNSTVDRISVLSSLCTNTPLNSSSRTAAQELLHRIRECGRDNGCMDIFKSSFRSRSTEGLSSPIAFLAELGKGTNFFSPSGGLPPLLAERTCKRIEAKARCEEYGDSSSSHLQFLQSPAIRSLAIEARARLDRIFPKSADRISAELLEIYPDSKEDFNHLEQSGNKCFQKFWQRNPDGSLQASAAIHPLLPAYSPKSDDDWIDRHRHFYQFMRSELEKDPDCWGQPDLVLDDLHISVHYNMTDRLGAEWFKRLLGDHSSLQADPVPSYNDHLTYRNPGLDLVLGADWIKRYLDAVRKQKPNSQELDCEKAGFHPFRNS